MLALAEFIAKLTGMLGTALHSLNNVRQEQRQKQSQYLDSVSETLAAAAAAIQTRDDPTKYFAELGFHLDHIAEVLRLGDPDYLMALSDDTVSILRKELDLALEQTSAADFNPTSETWSEREGFKTALLNASGVFRGASIALRASDRGPSSK